MRKLFYAIVLSSVTFCVLSVTVYICNRPLASFIDIVGLSILPGLFIISVYGIRHVHRDSKNGASWMDKSVCGIPLNAIALMLFSVFVGLETYFQFEKDKPKEYILGNSPTGWGLSLIAIILAIIQIREKRRAKDK